MRLVLLGPPGSGKGTQASTLAEELEVPHIATGDLFRAEIESGSEAGVLANSYIRHGNLVPNEVVNLMMRARLAQPDCEGFVLDGYPRTVQQADALEETLREVSRPLSAAISIEVPDEAIVERAIGRLLCPDCGAIYHLTSKPPRLPGICDVCRAQLSVREDDQPSTVRHRLTVYHRITKPVLEFYQERNLLRTVDGIGTREEIGQRVRAQLRALC
jgi:adenylate kinase